MQNAKAVEYRSTHGLCLFTGISEEKTRHPHRHRHRNSQPAGGQHEGERGGRNGDKFRTGRKQQT